MSIYSTPSGVAVAVPIPRAPFVPVWAKASPCGHMFLQGTWPRTGHVGIGNQLKEAPQEPLGYQSLGGEGRICWRRKGKSAPS